jgi:hypothetical protein
LAVVSVTALLAALGLAALLILQPWAANSVSPQLRVSPGLEIGLGDSVAVSKGGPLAIAPARPAIGGKRSFVASEEAGSGRPREPQPAVAAAHAVTAPGPAAAPEASPEPSPPEPLPTPQSSPTSVAVPVAAPTPSAAPEPLPEPPARGPIGGHSPGAVGAGAGPLGGAGAEVVEVHNGDEHAFSFSFYVEPTAYRAPGDENLIVQFRGEESESPSFGLQLWDDGSGTQRGLWSSGDAMGGERFLSSVEEGVWHEAVLCFKASSDGDGLYLLLLDGRPIDARALVSLIDPGRSDARIEVGLFRDGEPVVTNSDVLFGPTRLGDTLESVLP